MPDNTNGETMTATADIGWFGPHPTPTARRGAKR